MHRLPLPLGIAALFVFAALVALGTWQIERRAWKHALIARVEARVHAAPTEAPGRAQWAMVNAADHEYRHVQLSGRWRNDRSAIVQASTAFGSGYWLITPLEQHDGSIVIVNRGFVTAAAEVRSERSAAETDDAVRAPVVHVDGLLRMSEPGGGFLRRNDPAADRWYSRDVAALAASRELRDVAPYFVDAGVPGSKMPTAAGTATTSPIPGLTVIRFNDHHLVYALTWYALGLMVAVGTWRAAAAKADGDTAA